MNCNSLIINNLLFGHKFPLINTPATISANTGELVCFVGRNGTGKTTLLNTLIGALKPISGDITIDNTSILQIPARNKARYLSFVPSKIDNVPNLTVRDLIKIGRSPYTNIFDYHNEEDKRLIDQNIAKFQLSNIANRLVNEVSDGEKQKAMICRAIVQQTPIILLDEPTAFLDFFAKRSLLEELKNIAVNDKRCIIFSCHDIEVAMQFCTQVWLLDEMKLNSYSKEQFLSLNYLTKYK